MPEPLNVNAILSQFRGERNHFGGVLLKALRDAMPWGMEVDLGNGQTAILQPMNGVEDGSQPKQQPIYDSESTDPGIANAGEIIGYEEWSFAFDFKLINCDQDHIEVTAKITGGGGGV